MRETALDTLNVLTQFEVVCNGARPWLVRMSLRSMRICGQWSWTKFLVTWRASLVLPGRLELRMRCKPLGTRLRCSTAEAYCFA